MDNQINVKFLGKDIEYLKLVYTYLDNIRQAIVDGDNPRYIRLVQGLIDLYIYKDDDFKKGIEDIDKELRMKLNSSKDRYGEQDPQRREQNIVNAYSKKYQLLMSLLYRKKSIPQEAEEEEIHYG